MNNIDIVLTLIIPVAMIVGLNLKIAYSIWSFKNVLLPVENGTSAQLRRFRQRNQSSVHRISQHTKSRSNKQSHVTRTLLAISSSFIVLNLPSYAVRFLSFVTVSIVN